VSSASGSRLAYHARAGLILSSSRELSSSAVLVLLCLSHYSDGSEERPVWPSVDTLASQSRMSSRSVRRALRELESAGIVAGEERAGRSSRYRIAWSALASGPAVTISPRSGGERGRSGPGDETDCTPDKMTGVDQSTPDKMTGEGGQNGRATPDKMTGGAVILAADRFKNDSDDRSSEASERAREDQESDLSFLDEVIS